MNERGFSAVNTAWRRKAKDDKPAGDPVRVLAYKDGGYMVSVETGGWRRVDAQEFEQEWEPCPPDVVSERCPTCGQSVNSA